MGEIEQKGMFEMTELLHNAWVGWTGYIDRGKLAALLLAVLLYLWFDRKRRENMPLLLYTSVITICCIVPITAVGLMLYQTKFYNYEWIWSMVPLTAVTAYGITLFLMRLWERAKKETWSICVPVTLLSVAAVLFCGSMGGEVWDRQEEQRERQLAGKVLERIEGRYPGEAICLWAPREIMEYAREKDAGIILPYGRNIWDHFLDGYAYDLYEEEQLVMEQWMAQVRRGGEADLKVQIPAPEQTADAEDISADAAEKALAGAGGRERIVKLEECVQIALAEGVNCILLSSAAKPEVVQRMEKMLGIRGLEMEHYWVFYTGKEGLNERND